MFLLWRSVTNVYDMIYLIVKFFVQRQYGDVEKLSKVALVVLVIYFGSLKLRVSSSNTRLLLYILHPLNVIIILFNRQCPHILTILFPQTKITFTFLNIGTDLIQFLNRYHSPIILNYTFTHAKRQRQHCFFWSTYLSHDIQHLLCY